ncbi:tetracycline resistance protein [Fusarium pseudocircinatum]|uniref:Tetracycline resistance protein n=1 Tax=Fusarium pseudocircinatum TaxID=56676 RepID=A0A8H5NRY3_9HYPO|nr:tetracycline resistance protein [Fusarium pseudocircinatum]
MDITTFHSFPRLPFELREEIWQYACLRLRERRRDIHYLYMDEKRKIWPLDYDWKTDDSSSKSGYTWHSYIVHVGLWTACRESHDAVKKLERLFVSMRYLTRDICVITTDSWESLMRPWRPIYLQTEDARGRRRLMKPLNIGVKFDPSWDEEMQKAVETTYFATVLRDLYPPMAFAIRLLFEVATDDNYLRGRSKAMLIDDVSEWQSYDTQGHAGCRIFDSGQDPMDGFVENLNYLFLGKLNAACQRRWGHLLDADFLIPVLRRDKQVPMIRQ